MQQTPTLIAPPAAHPSALARNARRRPGFAPSWKSFCHTRSTDRTMPTPNGGNITRARQWYRALSAAVVDALENAARERQRRAGHLCRAKGSQRRPARRQPAHEADQRLDAPDRIGTCLDRAGAA